MLTEEQKVAAEKEEITNPIFLLQVKHLVIPQTSFEHELYLESNYFEEGGVFLTPDSYTDYLEADFREEPSEEFWRNCKTLDNDGLVQYGLAVCHWVTGSAWLTRKEAEQHAETRSYRYGVKDQDWRVQEVSIEGELAKLVAAKEGDR